MVAVRVHALEKTPCGSLCIVQQSPHRGTPAAAVQLLRSGIAAPRTEEQPHALLHLLLRRSGLSPQQGSDGPASESLVSEIECADNDVGSVVTRDSPECTAPRAALAAGRHSSHGDERDRNQFRATGRHGASTGAGSIKSGRKISAKRRARLTCPLTHGTAPVEGRQRYLVFAGGRPIGAVLATLGPKNIPGYTIMAGRINALLGRPPRRRRQIVTRSPAARPSRFRGASGARRRQIVTDSPATRP